MMDHVIGTSPTNGPPIPKLPGNTVQLHETMTRRRPQIFKMVNGMPTMNEKGQLVNDCRQSPDQYNKSSRDTQQTCPSPTKDWSSTKHLAEKLSSHLSSGKIPAVKTGFPPNWLAYDRQVLSFHGYFKEGVDNSPLETWRVRRCTVNYHLEDDTIHIIEPKQDNSGLPQGTLLRRHRANVSHDKLVTWADLKVGENISLYGRTYRLAGCDTFTRNWLTQRGVIIAKEENIPDAPHDVQSKIDQTRRVALSDPKAHGNVSSLFILPPANIQWLANRGKVLRFTASWEDAGVWPPQNLAFVLQYYLEDDTMEVREVRTRNDGKDPFQLLLHRMKLPKTVPPVGIRPGPDVAQELGTGSIKYYHWKELKVGQTVHVYGRNMLIVDCDEFTRNYYRHQKDFDERSWKPILVDFTGKKEAPPISIPPNTLRIGSEEDTLRNVLHLTPKLPKNDYFHYLENSGKILRFAAKMICYQDGKLQFSNDKNRRFIINYYMEDGTLSIYEPPQTNSGIQAGMFLERSRARVPHTNRTYTDQDLHIGATIQLHSRAFEIVDADGFTLKHMESLPSRYPHADYNQVMSRLQSQLKQNSQLQRTLRLQLVPTGSSSSGKLSSTDLHASLQRAGVGLSMHEVVTLTRSLSGSSPEPTITGSALLEALQLNSFRSY